MIAQCLKRVMELYAAGACRQFGIFDVHELLESAAGGDEALRHQVERMLDRCSPTFPAADEIQRRALALSKTPEDLERTKAADFTLLCFQLWLHDVEKMDGKPRPDVLAVMSRAWLAALEQERAR